LPVRAPLGHQSCESDGAKAILNLRWSRNPLLLTDSLEKAVAAVTTATYWATALWYMTQEDKPTSGLLTVVGGLQAWSAFSASK
jgi:predicted NAD/FAD-dependent oxidoreductase